ncbi:MAG: hypothetical protein NZ992_03970, partial [Candidatus Korarchaeum sp.]|nr:hypothetical protein [Candidatus Korarchaeum sp.]MDW8034940.1 hypothetical protein [Candidatus Korarchaeum sp.]
MLRKEALATLVLVTLATVTLQVVSAQVSSAKDVKLWTPKRYVTIDEDIELNIFWSDVGCSEYHVVLFRTYPNGTTIRIPPEGYGDPLKAPGVIPMKLSLKGDIVGKHKFKYELYCNTSHLANSNELEVIVSKGTSSIEVWVSPERLLRGEEVKVAGSVEPKVMGEVTLEVVSPSELKRNVTLSLDGNFSYSLALNESGTWRFRASWGGNSGYLGASSGWVTVEVSEKPIRV